MRGRIKVVVALGYDTSIYTTTIRNKLSDIVCSNYKKVKHVFVSHEPIGVHPFISRPAELEEGGLFTIDIMFKEDIRLSDIQEIQGNVKDDEFVKATGIVGLIADNFDILNYIGLEELFVDFLTVDMNGEK